MSDDDFLSLWTIYESPADYVGQYVVRRTEIRRWPQAAIVVTNDMYVADSLEEARELLPPGLFCVGRQPDDDPVIAEVWL